MSRPLRIEFPGAHYHVTSRGNARRKIFLDDVDREVFLVTLVNSINYGMTNKPYGLCSDKDMIGLHSPIPAVACGEDPNR